MREPGFYWVRASDPRWNQAPHVAEWYVPRGGEAFDGARWLVAGSEVDEPDSAFVALSERLVPPACAIPDTPLT